ncbi:MAG: carboxypeptidase regulatory-like domain-containing protein [Ilumatobacteraceae bacterium]
MTNETTHNIRRFLATALAGSAVALAFAAGPASAAERSSSNQSITGRLVDVRTRQPLAGIRVTSYSYADGSRSAAVTDANGRFTLNRLQGDEFEVKVLRSARHCAGTVKVLGLPGAPLDAMTTRRELANTFSAGDRGTIGVSRYGSVHCE